MRRAGMAGSPLGTTVLTAVAATAPSLPDSVAKRCTRVGDVPCPLLIQTSWAYFVGGDSVMQNEFVRQYFGQYGTGARHRLACLDDFHFLVREADHGAAVSLAPGQHAQRFQRQRRGLGLGWRGRGFRCRSGSDWRRSGRCG
ncbi:hypothetical protein LP420_39720 [Massilia sp. B-10]|nr:hypothetical protein LP420_39720 [Massilia sp. B-10]